MKAASDIVNLTYAIADGNFETQAEYDDAIMELLRACQSEHRRITVSDNGETWARRLTDSCRWHIIDTYLGGIWPCDPEERMTMKHIGSVLSKYLREQAEIGSRAIVYAEEYEKMYAMLSDSEVIHEVLMSRLKGAKADWLTERWMFGATQG